GVPVAAPAGRGAAAAGAAAAARADAAARGVRKSFAQRRKGRRKERQEEVRGPQPPPGIHPRKKAERQGGLGRVFLAPFAFFFAPLRETFCSRSRFRGGGRGGGLVHELGQLGLLARGQVGVDDALGGGLVELLGRGVELGLQRVGVAVLGRGQ